MITLAKHIELLLLEHDCVIVPGLGGFIANCADARYVESDEHLFLPPYRTIGFNQQLQVNDGLLVQSYMAAYDTSYPFAYLQMEKDVEKMVQELNLNGEYTLENVGVIKKGLNQNITFTAPEPGALTPSLYGLYSYEIEDLQAVLKKKTIEKNLQQTASAMQIATSVDDSPKSSQRDVVIHLNRHWLDFGISVAAAVVLLFCFSYPAMKNIYNDSDTVVAAFTPMNSTLTSSTQHPHTKINSSMRINTVPQTTKVFSEEGKAKEHTHTMDYPVVENTTVKNAPAKSTPIENMPITAKPTIPRFSIVLASFVSQENAEKFMTQLAREGYPDAQYTKVGKTSRILYSGYSTESEAHTALKTLRQAHPAFAEAWILEIEKEKGK